MAATGKMNAFGNLKAQAVLSGDDDMLNRVLYRANAHMTQFGMRSAEAKFKGDNSQLKRKAVESELLAAAVGMLRPSIVIAAVNDPAMTSIKQVKNALSAVMKSPKPIPLRVDTGNSVSQTSLLGSALRKTGNSAITVNSALSGKDGSIARKVVEMGASMIDGAQAAAAMSLALGKFAVNTGEAGAAAGGMGGKIGGLAASLAASAASAGAAGVAFGVLAAMIMPVMAILATGVATLAAVGAGLGLVGAAGAMLAKDFGTVSAANNRVEDAQYALTQAQKAGAEEMKKLKPLSDQLAKSEDAEKAAKDRLSKAWDTLNAARSPKNAGGVKKLEEDIAHIQAEQGTETRNLDDAWKDLTAARKAGNQKEIATQERRIAEAEEAQEGRTKALDGLWTKLDKARNPKNAKAVAAAEKEITAAEADLEKKTTAVESATKKLESARKGSSSLRILEAERELGKAQNAQAVALKKASGGSADYAKGLERVHTQAGLLGPAFRKAFTPAAADLADMTANTMKAAREAMPALGQASKKTLDQMREGFDKGHSSSTKLKDVLDPLPGIMGDIGGTTKNLKSAWTTFMDVALPYVKDFTQWVEDASKRLAQWMDSEEGRKKIAEFLDMAAPVAKKLGEFFKEVGTRLFELAEEHGPLVLEFLDLMVDSVGLVTGALEAALDIAKALLDVWKAVNEFSRNNQSPTSRKQQKNGQTMSPTYAYGGTMQGFANGGDAGQASLYRAANGLSELGAHFVNGPTYGSVGGNTALYGEALSQQNREYAFPMDNGAVRFITEEPGYNGNSYSLWRDLGQRQGYFTNNTGPAPKAPSVSAGSSGSQSAGSSTAGIERRLDTQTTALVGAVERNTEATERVAPGVRDSVNHNNEHSPQGRSSVQKGLSRDATKQVFEGRLT